MAYLEAEEKTYLKAEMLRSPLRQPNMANEEEEEEEEACGNPAEETWPATRKKYISTRIMSAKLLVSGEINENNNLSA